MPGTKDFAGDSVEAQAEQVMSNLGAILAAAGSEWGKVVKTTILLVDMADFATVNAVYGKYFPENPPARATFAVKGEAAWRAVEEGALHSSRGLSGLWRPWPQAALVPSPTTSTTSVDPPHPVALPSTLPCNCSPPHTPIRSTHHPAGLPLGALVEIEATALL